MFIVFDGVDGAGKSTQLRMSAEHLRREGRTVVCCADPGSTGLGRRLREILLDKHGTAVALRAEMLMFMAARAQLVEEIVRPALAAGEIVLCDRFNISTLVYQGYAGGLPVDSLRKIASVATGGTEPDLTLVFDIPLSMALERIGDRALDRMESRGREYLESVRKGFLQEAQEAPHRVRVIDAAPSPEVVFASVLHQIGQLIAGGDA